MSSSSKLRIFPTSLTVLSIAAITGLGLASMNSLAQPQQQSQANQDQTQQHHQQSQQQMQVKDIVRDWPQTSQKAANAMMEKYGQPDETTASMLIWEDNDPWLRTIVYKEAIDHDFPMPHQDVLEQFIPYEVAPDKFDELAQYDGSVIVERTKGEMSARCDKEAANFIALNLADKIVKEEMGVEEARQAYADAIQATMQGNAPDLAQTFTFEVPRDYAGASDERIIMARK